MLHCGTQCPACLFKYGVQILRTSPAHDRLLVLSEELQHEFIAHEAAHKAIVLWILHHVYANSRQELCNTRGKRS